MPRLKREYPAHRFAAETVRVAYEVFKQAVAGEVPEERRARLLVDGEWRHLNEAHQFFDVYTADAESAELSVTYKTSSFLFSVDAPGTRVEVGLSGGADAAEVIEVFRAAAAAANRRWSVFVGHGRDPVWTHLSDHLASQSDLQVRTYENSIAAGVTAIELLEQFAAEVDFAILIHTRDGMPSRDEGQPSANVVHETGFFQGALGRHLTLVVRERGCPSFHNIGGLHEVTFEPNAIDDAFEHVLRLIRGALLSST